jgi:predicted RNA-binding Zn-ribbon protein involved in translation (DUF1610 family)
MWEKNMSEKNMSEKNMSEKMTKEKMVEVCPVCGSSELYYETGGAVGKVYHCKDCNYIGALVVEADDEMIKAIKEEYKREKGKEGEES